MKMVPTDTKSAVPSMLTVAPMGSTKREIRGSTPHLSFMQRNVIGSVAALWKDQVLVFCMGDDGRVLKERVGSEALGTYSPRSSAL